MKFAILGQGVYGEALGWILRKNGHDTDFYDPYKSDKGLDEVLDGAGVMLLAVPSTAVGEILAKLPKNLPLVVATKGILRVETFEGFDDVMVISGAGFAADLNDEKPTRLAATDERLVEWFETEWLRLVLTRDERGVLMCGALKNVYAIEAGRRQLERETEEWRDFIDGAEAELAEILMANGAEAATAKLPCGRDDLELTCGLPSRNYEFGMKLAENPAEQPEKTVEGLSTLKQLREGAIIVPEEAEILREIMEEVK